MTSNPAETRQRLIKLIHVARRELGLDEDTYRTMLRTAGGADSTTLMDVRALKAVVEHAKRAGFKVRATSKAASTSTARPDRRQDTSVEARKVRALWLFLHHLGAVRDPSERALATYVKRIAKVDDLHWAPGAAMFKLIETLKKWAMRYLPGVIKAMVDQCRVAHAQQPFNAEQLDLVQHAFNVVHMGQGFDKHWWAYEDLLQLLGGGVQAQHRDAGAPRPKAQGGAK